VEISYRFVPPTMSTWCPPRGFSTRLDDLKNPPAYVVYPGSEYYPLRPGVFALPIAELHCLME
jgi:hypothetical protein